MNYTVGYDNRLLNFLLLYTSSHILEMFWIILGLVLGQIRPKKTVFWQLIPAENGLIIYVTMPIAIATDQSMKSCNNP